MNDNRDIIEQLKQIDKTLFFIGIALWFLMLSSYSK